VRGFSALGLANTEVENSAVCSINLLGVIANDDCRTLIATMGAVATGDFGCDSANRDMPERGSSGGAKPAPVSAISGLTGTAAVATRRNSDFGSTLVSLPRNSGVLSFIVRGLPWLGIEYLNLGFSNVATHITCSMIHAPHCEHAGATVHVEGAPE
jgi:hypothetical protein